MAEKQLQAGDLDRFLDILTLDKTRNTTGEMFKSLSPFLSGIPCKKQDVSGKEKPEAERETAFGRTDFTIRYQPTIKAVMKLRCEGEDYDILAVKEGPGRHQWTIIEAQKHD